MDKCIWCGKKTKQDHVGGVVHFDCFEPWSQQKEHITTWDDEDTWCNAEGAMLTIITALLMIVNPIVWILCIVGMVQLWLDGRRAGDG